MIPDHVQEAGSAGKFRTYRAIAILVITCMVITLVVVIAGSCRKTVATSHLTKCKH